jgi:hypothetical protein
MHDNFVHSCYDAVTVTGALLSVNANLSLWNTEMTSIKLHFVINGMNECYQAAGNVPDMIVCHMVTCWAGLKLLLA